MHILKRIFSVLFLNILIPLILGYFVVLYPINDWRDLLNLNYGRILLILLLIIWLVIGIWRKIIDFSRNKEKVSVEEDSNDFSDQSKPVLFDKDSSEVKYHGLIFLAHVERKVVQETLTKVVYIPKLTYLDGPYCPNDMTPLKVYKPVFLRYKYSCKRCSFNKRFHENLDEVRSSVRSICEGEITRQIREKKSKEDS